MLGVFILGIMFSQHYSKGSPKTKLLLASKVSEFVGFADFWVDGPIEDNKQHHTHKV